MSIFAGKDPIWTARRGAVSAGLVGHWDSMALSAADRMGNIWYDISGNNNHGTLTNGASFGRIGVGFDGLNDSVETNIRSLLYAMPAISCSFWAYVRSTSQQRFLSNWDGGSGFIVMSESGGNLTFYLSNPSTLRTVSTGKYLTTMSHVCAIYDGSKMEVWLNSQLVGSLTGLSGVTGTSGRWLQIGAGNAGQFTNGVIDDVRIYNRALSNAEILRNFNATRARFGV